MLDIPVRSAVLLLHDESSLPILNKNGSLSSDASHNVIYSGRQEEYAQRGGCDRTFTSDDARLLESQKSYDLQRQLSYVARTGEFAEKGKGRMEDATYWGQNGALTREYIERDMMDAKGYFLKSLITVDRRYADELKLNSKESFQKLLRANWVEMIQKCKDAPPAKDIGWFANYHTDHEHNLHVHITTYFKDGSMPRDWKVSAAETRTQKLTLYRDAYSALRLERNRTQDFYRALLPQIARMELGQWVTRQKASEIDRKANILGIEPPKLKQTLTGETLNTLYSKAFHVKEELQKGYGRISKNYPLKAAAVEVHKYLLKESEPYKEAWEEYRKSIDIKADLNGLGTEKIDESSLNKIELERALSAQEITLKERQHFINKELADINWRIDRVIINAVQKDRSEISDYDLYHLTREIKSGILSRASQSANGENRIGLTPEEETFVKQALRNSLDTGSCVSEAHDAIKIIFNSATMQTRIDEGIDKYIEKIPSYQRPSDPEWRDQLRSKVSDKVEEDLFSELRARVKREAIDPDIDVRHPETKHVISEMSPSLWKVMRCEDALLRQKYLIEAFHVDPSKIDEFERDRETLIAFFSKYPDANLDKLPANLSDEEKEALTEARQNLTDTIKLSYGFRAEREQIQNNVERILNYPQKGWTIRATRSTLDWEIGRCIAASLKSRSGMYKLVEEIKSDVIYQSLKNIDGRNAIGLSPEQESHLKQILRDALNGQIDPSENIKEIKKATSIILDSPLLQARINDAANSYVEKLGYQQQLPSNYKNQIRSMIYNALSGSVTLELNSRTKNRSIDPDCDIRYITIRRIIDEVSFKLWKAMQTEDFALRKKDLIQKFGLARESLADIERHREILKNYFINNPNASLTDLPKTERDSLKALSSTIINSRAIKAEYEKIQKGVEDILGYPQKAWSLKATERTLERALQGCIASSLKPREEQTFDMYQSNMADFAADLVQKISSRERGDRSYSHSKKQDEREIKRREYERKHR